MGYSCTAKAAMTLEAICSLINTETSNGMPDGGFYERGRENDDGAITGTVWKPWPSDRTRVVRRGSFRINEDGKVVRFPGLPSDLLRKAEKMAGTKFTRRYGCI